MPRLINDLGCLSQSHGGNQGPCSMSISPAQPVAAGATVIVSVCVMLPNVTWNTQTCADSQGNTYHASFVNTPTSQFLMGMAFFASQLTHALATSDAITFTATLGTGNGREIGMGAAAFSGVDPSSGYAGSGTQGKSAGNYAPTVSYVTTSTPVSPGDLIVGTFMSPQTVSTYSAQSGWFLIDGNNTGQQPTFFDYYALKPSPAAPVTFQPNENASFFNGFAVVAFTATDLSRPRWM